VKRLDILFISPNTARGVYQELSNDFSAIEPPVWAGMLASHCRSKGYAVDILDCEALRLSDATAVSRIKDADPRAACFVVYGQQPSASSQNMTGAVALADSLKLAAPGIKTVFVGGHVAALSREVLERHPSADFVCQNEGVYTISTLLASNLKDQLDKVPGLGYRDGKNVVLNPPSPIVAKEDLSRDLPGVAWDLLPMGNYRTSLWHSYPNGSQRRPFASLYTSLGCPMKCQFCMINIINRQDNEFSDGSAVFRYWDPEHIIKDFDFFASQGIVNVKIADELFVLNPNHFLKLCALIIERGYKFNIWCYSRVDTVKDRYLETLKRAGVNWLALGVESASASVRKDAAKGGFADVNIRDIVKKTRAHGINAICNYIFGLPEDDPASMRATLDLALEMNTEEANFYSAMAYPGSPLHGLARREGWELPDAYSGFSQHSYDCRPLPTKHLRADEVLAFRDAAWTEYHAAPAFLELLRTKFGAVAVEETLKSARIKLKRKLLGDAP
jgi:radical SAM superfamily enzyme YgiQ (UPF0313 family)